MAYIQGDVLPSSPSKASAISPTERTPTLGHEEHAIENIPKSTSFFSRNSGPGRAQEASKDEAKGPLGLRSLFCAPEPLIDLIFVHGLRGGSVKTWRFEEVEKLFWPRHWLPNEPELANASIHSFGYDSDWGSSVPSILNVHDFGRSLYEEMFTSPLLRHDSKNNPIILIGHSMGGLVIKAAYNLAHENKINPALSERIRCIFFLATPHRGSDYAAVLNRVLKFTGVTGLTHTREYIRDLATGSAATQIINNDFARNAKDLMVYSFCETLPTISGSSNLIVDKASAILGLHPKNEHIQYLRANHRDICKFRSVTDSNYLILKNALATAVEDLIRNAATRNDFVSKHQMRDVQDLLCIRHVAEEYHDRLEGSCEWIGKRDDFRAWIRNESGFCPRHSYRPSIFWVQAHPGAGKTVLATHVVSQLSHLRLPHATYFFHFGKESAQSLTGLLQSLALQMASTDSDIRRKLVGMHNTESSFDHDDARVIWQKIFVGGIFQVTASRPQFWIIDAIDECAKYSELFTLLQGLQSYFPLKIFMTSRKLPNMSRLTRLMESCETAVIDIPLSDTSRDIQLYIRSRIADLPIDEEQEREDLARQILAKSDSSFLWVRLVMDELEGVYGYDSILQVLKSIPEGMFPYYGRVVAEMGEKKRERHVAKAILLWVMLATRPLSIHELSTALQLDVKIHLPSVKSAIEGLCGQLVTIDTHTGLIAPVHATAREFVLSEEAGEFRISKAEGHEQIALTCLRVLAGSDMQPPRHRRLLVQRRLKPPASALTDYAITQFSEHVVSASSGSETLLLALDKFLKSTVLTWIEHIMIKKEAYRLMQVAKNLKAYLNRRAKYHSPLDRHVSTIGAWAADLTRIVSSFGRALIRKPEAIYFLIPPVCPTQSAIFQQSGRSLDGLALAGYRRSEWSDCVANIHFGKEKAEAVGCGNNLIAIGTKSGKVEMYNSRSFQKEKSIEIEFTVGRIHFDPFGNFLALSGQKFVGVWEISGTVRWMHRMRNRCMHLSSLQDLLMGITPQGRSFQWNIDTGELVHEQQYVYQDPVSTTGTFFAARGGAPIAATLSPGLELVALAYRNSPVCIFDCSNGSLISWAIQKDKGAPEQLIFNPNPEVELLLVAYDESHLALYDSWSGNLVESVEAESHVILNSVTCSLDGRTFAAVDVRGHLRIWDFESLTLLYHVLTPSVYYSILKFTSEGLRLVQMVDHEMRIWSPSALVRKTIEEEASLSGQSPVLPVTEGQFEKFRASKISTMCVHLSWPILFTGNRNGEVVIYQANNDYEPLVLYSHGEFIKCIACSRHNAIASADLHLNVQIRHFDPSGSHPSHSGEILLQLHFKSPVTQLLFDASGLYILVSTRTSDHIYNIEDGHCIGSQELHTNTRLGWRWFVVQEANYCDHLLLMTDSTIAAFSTKNFTATPVIIYDNLSTFTGTKIESVTHIPGTLDIVVETQESRPHTRSHVLTLPPWNSLGGPEFATIPEIAISSQQCAQFLGVNHTSKRLVLLQPDSWVCSVDSNELRLRQYVEHFFVPEEFRSLDSEIHPVQTGDGDFAFCMYDRVVVVRGGLKFQTPRALA